MGIIVNDGILKYQGFDTTNKNQEVYGSINVSYSKVEEFSSAFFTWTCAQTTLIVTYCWSSRLVGLTASRSTNIRSSAQDTFYAVIFSDTLI